MEPSNDLAGVALSRGKVFLGMDGLEHQGHLAQLAGRHMAEDVAIEVHHAALPARLGKELGGTLDKAHAGVGDDQLDTLQAAPLEVAQEGAPAGSRRAGEGAWSGDCAPFHDLLVAKPLPLNVRRP